MGQAKVRKKNGTYMNEKVRKEIFTNTTAPVRKIYAEWADEALEEHRRTCTDPKCDESEIALKYAAERVVPMIHSHKPKEIFLTIDYKPFQALQLLDGAEIANLFDEDGGLTCAVTRTKCDEVCVEVLCHSKGVVLVLVPKEPGVVRLCCADQTCRKTLVTVRLAPKPKAELPYLVCDYHGVQPGYAICRHVLEGAEPTVLQRETAEMKGFAACNRDCTKTMPAEEAFKTGLFVNICKGHLNDRLKGRLEELLTKAEQ